MAQVAVYVNQAHVYHNGQDLFVELSQQDGNGATQIGRLVLSPAFARAFVHSLESNLSDLEAEGYLDPQKVRADVN